MVSASNNWLVKGVDWAVIDHMSQGVTPSTDPKVADIVRVSPSMAEITLGRQTMMCSVSQRRFPTGRTSVHGARESVMAKIRANIAPGEGRARA